MVQKCFPVYSAQENIFSMVQKYSPVYAAQKIVFVMVKKVENDFRVWRNVIDVKKK